ncbi:MAG: MMPL family transporter [Streptosporangiales bacterium]|nr:MMPL family transporter [Streptosporangiales bacterium]
MSFLSRISLANRGLVTLIALAALVFGGVAATSLRQELVPSLEFPAAVVVTPYQGAAPEIVEREVTEPLEDRISGLPNQTRVTSYSSEGNSIIQVEYGFGTNMDDATQELQEAVNQVGRELPENVRPTVTVGSTDSLPVVMLAASSSGGEQDLVDRLNDAVVPRIESISGVSGTTVSGARDQVVTVRLDTDKLEDKGLTVDQVTGALQSNGLSMPGGTLDRGDDSLSVQVGNGFSSIEEIENLYILPVGGASPSAGGAAGGAAGVGAGAAAGAAGTRPAAAANGAAAVAPASAVGPTSSTSPTSSMSPTSSVTPTPTPTLTPTVSPTASPTISPTGSPSIPPTTPPGNPPGIPPGQFPGQLPPGAIPGGFPGQLPPGAFPGSIPMLGMPPGIVAPTPPTPDAVRLGEVAKVGATLAEPTSYTRTNGEPSLGVLVTKTQDGNAVDISQAIQGMMPELGSKLGAGGQLSVVFDQSPYIEQSIEGLTTEGLLGLAFAVLAILVFLLSIRSTVVTAVSIPLSVLVALIVLWTGDFSLNILTLGGLTIAVGRVVDDSIVVLENIKRHLEYGGEKAATILTAVREVAGAITASTLTTVAVFLPIVFVGGQVGELFRPFGLTITVALAASLLVSLTVIPVLAYWFLKTPRRVTDLDPESVRELAVAREERSPLQRGYVPVIRWAARHRFIALLLAFLVFVGTMGLLPRLGTNFLGQEGQNTFTVSQELPPGTSLTATNDAAKHVEAALDDLPETEAYQVNIGSFDDPIAAAFGGTQTGSNTAQFSIISNLEADQAKFEHELRERLAALPPEAGELSVSAGGVNSAQLEVIVQAPDTETLRAAAAHVEGAVGDMPSTADVTSNLSNAQPRVQIRIDREEAAERGLTEVQIGQMVNQVYQGTAVADAYLEGERRAVVVRLGSSATDIDELRDLKLATPTGSTVKLRKVADVVEDEGPVRITHIDGERSASVTGTATAENVGAVSNDLQQRLSRLSLPEGATYSLAGVTTQQQEAFSDLGIALLAAILIVYLIMMATFRSVLQPLILMVSVPFAATGAVVLLLATGTELGVPSLIGMLMLVGIVVTNAIVLLDLINQYRKAGMDPEDAVIAGGRRRLRPILMTAVATICALTPMALGLTGDGGFLSQPLAMVVIGGLTSSTVLTLIVVPTLYLMTERLKGGFGRRRRDAASTTPG